MDIYIASNYTMDIHTLLVINTMDIYITSNYTTMDGDDTMTPPPTTTDDSNKMTWPHHIGLDWLMMMRVKG